MPKAKKFNGPLVAPLAIKFDAINTKQPSCNFLKLSPEIRNIIYEIVLAPEHAPTVSDARPYNLQRKLSLSLLSTCRQIYLETHLHPLQTNMHLDTLFPCRSRGIDLQAMYSRYPFGSMAQWQKSTIDEIHLIVEMCHSCIKRGLYLKVILARTGMAGNLRKLHLHWVPEWTKRRGCPRRRYWTGQKTRDTLWDLGNFALLEEITIMCELGTTRYINHLNIMSIRDLAKTWRFRVGGNRILTLDSNHPTQQHLVPVTYSMSFALRWI